MSATPAIVDAHAHYLRLEWLDRLWPRDLRRESSLWPRLQLRLGLLTDLSVLVTALDARGYDRAVIFPELSVAPGPQIPGGATAALALTRAMNDATAALVAQHPDRLIGLAVVNPLGGAEDLAEMRRAVVAQGLRGVAVGSSYAGATIAAPAARPFLALAEALGAPVVVHPAVGGDWQKQHDFGVDLTAGVPMDVTALAARLLTSGRLTEFPRLSVVLTHLGGGLLAMLGWLDAVAPAQGPRPGRRARGFYGDRAPASRAARARAGATLGADHVLLGTDWPLTPPARAGDPLSDPLAMVEHSALGQDERALVLGAAAHQLFGW